MKTQYVAAAVLSALILNPLPAGAEGKDGVAAVVNGKKITVAEIKKTYESAPQIKAQVTFDQFYPQAVTVWANGEALQQAAKKAGVESSAEYKQQLEAMKSDLAGKVYLKQEVEKKISDNDVKNFYWLTAKPPPTTSLPKSKKATTSTNWPRNIPRKRIPTSAISPRK
mgnify:CR=1 FL=1